MNDSQLNERLSRIESLLREILSRLPAPGEVSAEIVAPGASEAVLAAYLEKFTAAREAEFRAIEEDRVRRGRPLDGVDDDDLAQAMQGWMNG